MVMLSVSTDHISMSLGGKQRKVEETSWKTLLMFVCLRGKTWQINKNRWIDSTGGWVEWVSSWVYSWEYERVTFLFWLLTHLWHPTTTSCLSKYWKFMGVAQGLVSVSVRFGSIRFRWPNGSIPSTKAHRRLDCVRVSFSFCLFVSHYFGANIDALVMPSSTLR